MRECLRFGITWRSGQARLIPCCNLAGRIVTTFARPMTDTRGVFGRVSRIRPRSWPHSRLSWLPTSSRAPGPVDKTLRPRPRHNRKPRRHCNRLRPLRIRSWASKTARKRTLLRYLPRLILMRTRFTTIRLAPRPIRSRSRLTRPRLLEPTCLTVNASLTRNTSTELLPKVSSRPCGTVVDRGIPTA